MTKRAPTPTEEQRETAWQRMLNRQIAKKRLKLRDQARTMKAQRIAFNDGSR
jgi:hypothetical protein